MQALAAGRCRRDGFLEELFAGKNSDISGFPYGFYGENEGLRVSLYGEINGFE